MILATTTEDFFSFAATHEERVLHLYEAGFRYVDLSLEHPQNDDPLYGDDYLSAAKKLREYAESLGMRFVQCHAPSCNFLAEEDKSAPRAKAAFTRAIEVCGVLGIPNVVTHAGWQRAPISFEEWTDRNRAFYLSLMPVAEAHGVRVLTENSAHVNLPNYYLYDGKAMRAFSDAVEHPFFGLCWDTGHANLEGSQYDEILALGDALFAIHLHDNRGVRDEHLLPFMGTVNMDEIMHALIDVGYTGAFTFEAKHSFCFGKVGAKERVAYPVDTRLKNPTLAMQKSLERTLFTIGKEILTAYNCFEG